MRFTASLLTIFALILLSACTKQLEPGELTVEFIETSDYELLSDEDKAIWSEDKWLEYANDFFVNPALQPTHQNYELEQFLHSMVSYEVTAIEETSEGHKVTVEFAIPKVLHEVSHFDDYGLKYKADEISNLQALFERGNLTASTISLATDELVFTVLPSGLFMDLAAVQSRRDKQAEIKEAFDTVSHVDDYDLSFTFYTDTIWTREVKALREISVDQITSDIAAFTTAIEFAHELMPSYSSFLKLYTLQRLHAAQAVLEADKLFNNHLSFNNIEISDAARSRGKGLFFDWSYDGEEHVKEEFSAVFTALFFDEDGTQIGSERFFGPFINLKDGNTAGNVGRIIENQAMARRAAKAEIRYQIPVGHISFDCSFDTKVTCSDD